MTPRGSVEATGQSPHESWKGLEPWPTALQCDSEAVAVGTVRSCSVSGGAGHALTVASAGVKQAGLSFGKAFPVGIK